MAVYDYAEKFEQSLVQKYAEQSKSDALFNSNPQVQFLNAQTIKLPRITVSGYKDHNRQSLSFNAGTVSNDWEAKKLSFDRDIEFAIDPMDLDETNLVVSVANIQNVFEDEQAIPERDSYAFSKLYTEYVTTYSQTPNTTALTTANILSQLDEDMSKMDDAGVPEDGRILYLTPAVAKLLKEAEGIQRNITVNSPNTVNRAITSLDNVQITTVSSGRMKTAYDFTDGVKAASTAKQINYILVHPNSVVARQKYAYIKLFTPGSDSRTADKYLFQNRRYLDLFLLEKRVDGVRINAEAAG